MDQNEYSDEPEHSISTKLIEAPVESTPSGGNNLTSTSTTTRKTSNQISTTIPPYYYSEVDATRELSEVLAHMHERNMKRFRSVCISGILWTLVFGGSVSYLINIDYIASEWGTPILGGLIAIFTGFFIGLWRSK